MHLILPVKNAKRPHDRVIRKMRVRVECVNRACDWRGYRIVRVIMDWEEFFASHKSVNDYINDSLPLLHTDGCPKCEQHFRPRITHVTKGRP